MATNYESIMIGQAVHEHEETLRAKRVTPVNTSGTQINAATEETLGGLRGLFIRSSGNYIYIATATPGTATSAAAWRVKRLDTTTLLDITWADGDTNFDNIAANYASLSYS